MIDFSLKYSMLDKSAQKEINDFMDFLLSKKRTQKSIPLSDYKKRLLSASTWTDADMKILEENQKLFNQWSINEW